MAYNEGTQDLETLRRTPYVFKLFGTGITHSKAPLIHNYMFAAKNLPWKYEIYDSSDVDGFNRWMGELKSIGAAVTMPNKVVMSEHVDMLDELSRTVGSINTIYQRSVEGKLVTIGANTDVVGIRDAFLQNAGDFIAQHQGGIGMVYGGGGTCRAAIVALYQLLNCKTIYVINRFADEVEVIIDSMKSKGFSPEIIHVISADHARSLPPPSLIVSAIPNIAPSTELEIEAFNTLLAFLESPKKGVVLEMCYQPQPITFLFKHYEKLGWKAIGGLEVVFYQAFAQQVLWTGYTLKELPTKETIEYIKSL